MHERVRRSFFLNTRPTRRERMRWDPCAGRSFALQLSRYLKPVQETHMNTKLRTTALHRASLACAAGLLAASSAQAVDWTGYMRGGPAATNVPAESRQCY